MVSGFMCPCHGEWENAQLLTLGVGKNRDGYFNSTLFIEQVEQKVLFGSIPPSTASQPKMSSSSITQLATNCFKPDALVATHLNFKEGGFAMGGSG